MANIKADAFQMC